MIRQARNFHKLIEVSSIEGRCRLGLWTCSLQT